MPTTGLNIVLDRKYPAFTLKNRGANNVLVAYNIILVDGSDELITVWPTANAAVPEFKVIDVSQFSARTLQWMHERGHLLAPNESITFRSEIVDYSQVNIGCIALVALTGAALVTGGTVG